MTQDVSRIPQSLIATGTVSALSSSSAETVIVLDVEDVNVLGIEMLVETQDLAALELDGRTHPDADWVTVKTTGWDTPDGILLRTDGTLDTLPVDTPARMHIDVRMFYQVRLRAQKATAASPLYMWVSGASGRVQRTLGPDSENPIGTALTLILAHYEGSDTQTTTTDEIAGITHTLSNGAELDTAIAKFGSSSLTLDSGTAEDLITGLTLDPSAPWTFEFWYQNNDTNGIYIGLFDNSNNICVRVAIDHDVGSLAVIAFNSTPEIIWNDTGSLAGSVSWHHYAICYDGTNFYWFQDGTRLTNTSGGTIRTPTRFRAYTKVYGAAGSQNNVDELRVSAVARYPNQASITVPSAPFTAD